MTTSVKVTLEEFTGHPVEVIVTSMGKPTAQRYLLSEVGESAQVYVHQNQDVHVGEIKTNAA